jgi:peptidoglycan/LPS O-acetylase OafA/YrhL
MIAACVHLYDSETPFPGLAAVPACLGTFLFIWSNTEAKTRLGQLLSSKHLVGVGLISYSLYLWHWPLLLFAKYYLVRSLLPWEALAVLVTSGVLAVVSWRFVELPFRGKTSAFNRSQVFLGAAIAGSILFVIGAVGHFSGGLPSRARYALLDDSEQPHGSACCPTT